MPSLDADALYDLSQAGRILRTDPARLRRLARQGRIPSTWAEGRQVLPRAWVDAAGGRAPTDAEALRTYWLARLAPAAPEARRALRDRKQLQADDLLPPREAARRIRADEVRLRRLDAEGTLPALRLDGETAYDALLVARVAERDREAAATRRAEVLTWAQYEYATELDAGAAPPATATRPAAADSVAVAPRAWHLPDDLVSPDPLAPDDARDDAEPPSDDAPRRGLIEADGFETVDED